MSWDAEIILTPATGQRPEPLIADEGDFRFYADSSFRFANRVFHHKEAVDLTAGGFRIHREAGRRRLTVRCPDGEQVVFECEKTLAGARWIRWTPRAKDAAGTADSDPRPTLSVAAALFLSRLWHEFVGGTALLFGVLIFLLIMFGVISILASCL